MCIRDSFITVLALFIVVRLNQRILESRYIASYEKMMNIFDAIGLAAFTVTGIDTAVLAGYGDYHFLSVFLGVLTGVGGGVLRDIMAGNTPYIFVKHVYASASLAGALLCTVLWQPSYLESECRCRRQQVVVSLYYGVLHSILS